MEIDLRISDDYCQGERNHLYDPDELDWEEDEDKVIRTKARLKVKPRGRK